MMSSHPTLPHNGLSHGDHKLCRPTIIARLMGLEPLPHQSEAQSLHSQSEFSSKSLKPDQNAIRSSITEGTRLTVSSTPSSQRAAISIRKLIYNGNPSNRSPKPHIVVCEHAQNEQMQYANKDRAINELRVSVNPRLDRSLEIEENPRAHEGNKEKGSILNIEKMSFQHRSLQESQEFLDALNFLRSNKDFFAKVLKDPSSLFGKHSSKENLHQGKVSKQQRFADTKADDIRNKEENKQEIATKIVVLKSKEGKRVKSNSDLRMRPLSYVLESTAIDSRGEERQISTRTHNHGFKEKHQYEEREISTPTHNHGFKEKYQYESLSTQNKLPKDGEGKTRQIAEKTEDATKRRAGLSKITETYDYHRTRTRCKRTPNGQRPGVQRDVSSASDGEYSRSSRESVGDSMRVITSSPCLSHSDSEVNKSFSYKGKREITGGRRQSTTTSSAPIFRRLERAGNSGAESSSQLRIRKQDRARNSEAPLSRRKGREKSSVKDSSESLKVLQRSFSEPSARDRFMHDDGMLDAKTLPAPSKSRPCQRIPLRENILKSKVDEFCTNKKASLHFNQRLECLSSKAFGNVADPRGSEHVSSISSDYREDSAIYTVGCFNDDAFASNQVQLLDLHQGPVASSLNHLDGTMDVSSEKYEQPSPVSVLIMPSLEESPSSVQSTPDCNDVCVRPTSAQDSKDHHLDLQERMLPSLVCRNSRFSHPTEDMWSVVDHPYCLDEGLSGSNAAYPCGADDQFMYIRDVLAFAGFESNNILKTPASCKEQGLNPSIFEKLEDYYSSIDSQDYHIPMNLSNRRMIFDVISQILAKEVKEEAGLISCVLNQSRLRSLSALTRRQLLDQLWYDFKDEFYRSCGFAEDEDFDAVASMDIMRDRSWIQSQSDIEAIAISVEKFICGDLIRELAYDLRMRPLSMQIVS
ncbi:hypothetical protein KP509_18G013200 [Ceratopteris richardii]|nr:hypothetical protein KP509_18G013200 [Ceratopteris richardii]